MAEGYAKLLASIVRSSIWRESDATIRVWVTMLALADRNGDVFASVDGLAHQARKTEEETEQALALFLAPDPRSRSKVLDGRRVVEIDGGWHLVNYEKIRDMHESEASRARKREWWNRNRGRSSRLDTLDVTLDRLDDSTRTDRARACAHRCDPAPSPATTPEDPDLRDPEESPRGTATPAGATAPAAPKGAPTLRGPKPGLTQAPESIEPTEATLAVANATGRDWREDWRECRDWARGGGKLKHDWQATLRNWMTRAARDHGPSKPRQAAPEPPKPKPSPNLQRVYDTLAEYDPPGREEPNAWGI